VDSIRYFLTERGKIKPRRRAGTCARHQRMVAREIKRARHLALIPYSPEHVR
jgi:small subunit ribosomal protein S18